MNIDVSDTELQGIYVPLMSDLRPANEAYLRQGKCGATQSVNERANYNLIPDRFDDAYKDAMYFAGHNHHRLCSASVQDAQGCRDGTQCHVT